MNSRKILPFVFLVFTLLVPARVIAETDEWKLSASVNYESGKYGTDTRTETLYMPVTLKKYFGDEGDFSVTIPYISQTNSAEVAVVDGSVFQIRRSPGPAETNSGFGDLVLKGTYYLLSEGGNAPVDLNIAVKLKAPTADEKKGLGTGEFDAGAGLELARTLGSGLTGYFDVYYTAIGDPPGLDLEDRVSFDLGVSSRLDEFWTLSAFYEESTPLFEPNTNLRDILVSFEYRADDRMRLFFGATVGLTDTSPDYGLSVGASLLL